MAFGTHENAIGPLSSDDVIVAVANLTVTAATNAFTLPIEAVLKNDLSVVMTIPSITGTPTLVAVLTSTDSHNKIEVKNTDNIDEAGNYVIPIPPVRSSGWNLSLTVAGGSPVFVNFAAYIAKAGHAVLPST